MMDEARLGQQGTLTWVCLYAAVDPLSGESSALPAPHVNIATMEAFLDILFAEVGEDDHIVLVLDQAG
jgi:hypothetical protein